MYTCANSCTLRVQNIVAKHEIHISHPFRESRQHYTVYILYTYSASSLLCYMHTSRHGPWHSTRLVAVDEVFIFLFPLVCCLVRKTCACMRERESLVGGCTPHTCVLRFGGGVFVNCAVVCVSACKALTGGRPPHDIVENITCPRWQFILRQRTSRTQKYKTRKTARAIVALGGGIYTLCDPFVLYNIITFSVSFLERQARTEEEGAERSLTKLTRGYNYCARISVVHYYYTTTLGALGVSGVPGVHHLRPSCTSARVRLLISLESVRIVCSI